MRRLTPLPLVVVAVALAAPPAGAQEAPVRLSPVADATAALHGRALDAQADRMRISARRGRAGLVRFDLRPVRGPVRRAVLSLQFGRLGGGRLLVRRSLNSAWREGAAELHRRLQMTGPTVRVPVALSRRVEVDVTHLLGGSRSVTLALLPGRGSRAAVWSRQGPRGQAPILTVTSAGPSRSPGSGPGGAPLPGVAPPATAPSVPPAPAGDVQPSLPVRAAFYYPWFPETWSVGGQPVHFHPTLGLYSTDAVVDAHLDALAYAKVQVAFSSWWGQGTVTDRRLPSLLAATRRRGDPIRWAIYYEPESTGDPTVDQLRSDLTYIAQRYGSDPAYFRINGRPVVFVFTTGADGCPMADRWKAAAGPLGIYVGLKLVSGYRGCASQPDAWHQYAPAGNAHAVAGSSYSISPGFWQANEASPRLARDITRWRADVRAMVASGAPFQLVTTFNEWGEGTATESASEWATPSGFGAYLDALHTDGG